MLEDLFSDWFKYYHIDVQEDYKLTIRDDCPRDRFEALKESDEDFFKEEGYHLYTNFETEQQQD